MRTRIARRTVIVLATVAVAVAVAVGVPAVANAGTPAAPSGWTRVAHAARFTLTSNEGIATVHRPGGSSEYVVGTLSVPPGLAARGWGHIGDPDSVRGYVFDDFQYTGDEPTSKLFRVTTPGGEHYDYTHQLVSGEAMNNSWVAVSPDAQWMVNGEWGTMTRFLVFPTPLLNSAASPSGGDLDLAAQVTLDHPVRDVQGCTFADEVTLLCAADDPDTDLYPTSKQLLRVTLAEPLAGTDVTAHVSSLGQLPLDSACSGDFEVEGNDYDPATGLLRVLVVQPGVCAAVTDLYTFRRA